MTEFLDSWTREQLGFDHAMGLFKPFSELGGQQQAVQPPLLSGNQQRWEADRGDLVRLQSELKKRGEEWGRQLAAALTSLKSANPIFQRIELRQSLQMAEFLTLKQWMLKSSGIISIFPEGSHLFAWWPSVDWDAVLRILNPGEELTAAFQIDDGFDAVLKQLRNRRRDLQAKIEKGRREQAQELFARYGRMPNRQREYVWDRAETALLKQAESDPDLEFIGETSWEVLYRAKEMEVVLQLLQELEAAANAETEREQAVLADLTQRLSVHLSELQAAETTWGRLDWLLARIVTARKLGWSFPVLGESWQVKQANHPLLVQALTAKGEQATPVSFELRPGVTVLAGPNMGGKTLALKTAGVLQALAQSGMPVPASSFTFNFMAMVRFTGGDLQSVESGLSAFGGEAARIAEIVEAAESGDQSGLLLFDEVGRATNPVEGEALAVGMARYLQDTRHTVFFATHYAGVAKLQGVYKWRIAGFSDHRVIPADDLDVEREALQIAERLGLPGRIIKLAREWLENGKGEAR